MEIIFSKHSNERKSEFNIRTDILLDTNKKKIVQKRSCNSASQSHLDKIYKWYKFFSEEYKEEKYCLNTCEKMDQGVQFEFIEGNTLEQILDTFLVNRDDRGVNALLDEYVKFIKRYNEKQEFVMTDEFRKVFGDVMLPSTLKCASVSNIDLTFNNIIVQDGKWHIIDYEWCFDFPIPCDYILFRTIFFYAYMTEKRENFKNMHILERWGIDAERFAQYRTMEESFQRHLKGNHKGLGDLYQSFGKPAISISNWLEEEKISRKMKTFQVFFDYGQGFYEDNSYRIEIFPDDKKRIRLSIIIPPNTRGVRIDPGEESCIIKVEKVIGESDKVFELPFSANGFDMSSKIIVFNTYDPQIIVDNLPENVKNIYLEIVMERIEDTLQHAILSRFYELIQTIDGNRNERDLLFLERAQNNDLIERQRHTNLGHCEEIKLLKLKIDMQEQQLKIFKASTSWKVTEPFRKICGFVKKD